MPFVSNKLVRFSRNTSFKVKIKFSCREISKISFTKKHRIFGFLVLVYMDQFSSIRDTKLPNSTFFKEVIKLSFFFLPKIEFLKGIQLLRHFKGPLMLYKSGKFTGESQNTFWSQQLQKAVVACDCVLHFHSHIWLRFDLERLFQIFSWDELETNTCFHIFTDPNIDKKQ